jgi:RNA polymerase sigma-B factor
MKTRELFRELRTAGSQELRAYLIGAHDGLVRHVVKQYSESGESMEDLLGVARLGLINAIDRFDPERGTQFATYAVPTIRGEVRRHFRDKGWGLKVPRRLQELVLRTKKAMEDLTVQHGRSPTYPELAASLGESEDDVIQAVELSQQYDPLSMDTPAGEGEDGHDTAPEDIAGTPDESLESLGERTELATAIEALPAREREIIVSRYYRDESQTEIAKRLGISQMHVSRLQHRALGRLRRLLRDGGTR